MHRFYAFKKDKIRLSDEEQKHFKVLRIEEDELIELVIENKVFLAKAKKDDFEIIKEITKDPEIKVFLYTCVPIKLQTIELIIDFAVQGGAYKIIPVICKRGFQDKTKILQKYERLNKILKEAVKQSRPSYLPVLEEVSYLKNINPVGHKIFFDSYEKPKNDITCSKEYSVVIGPEGGFSKEEVEFLKNTGFSPQGLGDNILRQELAVFAGLTAIKICSMVK